MHTLGCRYRLKLAAQIANQEYKAFSSTLEYRSNNSTVSLTLANPSILKQHGTLVLHYLKAITSRITLGAEMAYQRCSQIPGHQQTIMSLAFRYSTGRSTLSTTVGEAGVHVCYHMKASHQLQLGVEIETNFRTHESETAIVYQMDLSHSNLIFRGLVNSESTVSAVIEKKLHPFTDSSLQISGLYNHKKEQFRVGVGLNVGYWEFPPAREGHLTGPPLTLQTHLDRSQNWVDGDLLDKIYSIFLNNNFTRFTRFCHFYLVFIPCLFHAPNHIEKMQNKQLQHFTYHDSLQLDQKYSREWFWDLNTYYKL